MKKLLKVMVVVLLMEILFVFSLAFNFCGFLHYLAVDCIDFRIHLGGFQFDSFGCIQLIGLLLAFFFFIFTIIVFIKEKRTLKKNIKSEDNLEIFTKRKKEMFFQMLTCFLMCFLIIFFVYILGFFWVVDLPLY